MNFSDVTKRVSAVQGFIGILPGLAAILYGAGVPPERELLFGAFISALLFVVTILVLSLKREIFSLTTQKKVAWASICLAVSGIALLVYLSLLDHVLITDSLYRDQVRHDIELYLPIFPTGELAVLVEQIGRYNLISDGFIEPDIEKYRGENAVRYLLNDVILIVFYVLAVAPLNAVLTGAAILLTQRDVAG
ncbi:hypothetical protein QMT40_002096 [Parvibaculaceae bacterium PLY_AMNH_Bact1]|nr:hypothetical protein QMT40_002096 [Parvibaculaceae bacterium PLY_AMNH_Bact1]